MKTLLAKELREGWRTWRLIVLVIVLAVSGLISPVLAYYMPQLFSLIPDMPDALMAAIPQPTMADAVGQYVKNVSQFGLLLLVVMTAGLVAGEKERGTAAMLFVRPVSRTKAVLAKWLVWAGALVVGLLVSGLLALAYTTFLFDLPPVVAFLALNGLLLLSFLPYLSLSLLGSVIAKTQGAAYGYAFMGMFLLIILGGLPRIGEFTPAHLTTWGAALMVNQPVTGWPALIVSVAIIVGALVVACRALERQEL
jgi:ABC-2 type transport system permease protein